MSKQEFYHLFTEELEHLLYAVRQIEEELPKIINAAASKDLKKTLHNYLNDMQNQILRLEEIFLVLDEHKRLKENNSVKALLRDGSLLAMSFPPQSPIKDAALIAACQKITYYSIAAYNSISSYAKYLSFDPIKMLLEQCLDEIHNINKRLTSLAQRSLLHSGINQEAYQSSTFNI